MKRNLKLSLTTLSAAVAMTFSAGALADTDSDLQAVGYEVTAVNLIDVSGTPSLTVNTTVGDEAGADLAVDTAAASYDITTNGTNMKITAILGSAMPSGVTLSATVTAPTGGSGGVKTGLSTTAADVVTGITQVAETGIAIEYELDAELSAGVVTSDSVNVTYTITSS